MGKIIQLDQHLANQIAAGEVVERPVSVVKELVENSIDAGATHIEVSIEQWGKTLIQVTDNGDGILREDLEICLSKYTTSKIKNLQDLYNVMTFGFRGEALSSISSVSQFEIISKTPDSLVANHLTFDTNAWQKITSTSANTGTTICVKNLFYNTPARLNYLKMDKTEHSKILDYLYAISLSYPNISFTYKNEGKTVFSFPSDQNLKTRIYNIYWEEFAQNMLEINVQTTWISLSWCISDPKVSFWNKNRQHIFVNHRPIFSPLLSRALSDAYNRFIPHGSYAGFVLYLDVDPTIVDVNVHPRKQEVRFENEQQIFKTLYHAVLQTLEKVSLLSQENVSSEETNVSQENTSSQNISSSFQASSPNYYTGSGTKFKSYSPYKDVSSHPNQTSFSQAIDFTKNILSSSQDISWEFWDQNTWDLHYTKLGKIIGQAFFSYILVERDKKLIMLDQHALAERVIYEKLLQKDTKDTAQILLVPQNIQLTPTEFDTLQNHQEIFWELGFEFEILSHRMISLSSIPSFTKKQDIQEIFTGILWDIQHGNIDNFKTLQEVKNKIFAYTACRSAIKFGNKLNLFEMNKLLNESFDTYSSTCPHGRPVIYEISLDELKNKYER